MPPADTSSLTQRAYVALEERITTLALKPGEVLSESWLSEDLGIGRTPVREALQRLAREGLVNIMPRRGIRVADFDIAAQLRMLDVRTVIECLMARNAARRCSAAQKAQFAEIADGMRQATKANDDIGFMRLDRNFNVLLSDSCGNEFATATMALMAGLARRFWFMHHLQVGDDLQEIAARHIDVATAIANGDAPAADAATLALMEYIEAITRAAVDW